MKRLEVEKIDRLALLMIREGKEKSQALPARIYRDPAETIEFPAERERRERLAKQKRKGDDMMQRVRKQDVKVDTWVKPDAFDFCLECWKTWMCRNDTDLGIQGQKLLNGEGDGYGNEDTSGMRRDNEIAAATDAMINSLRALHRWAIYRKCGITTVWSFPSADFISTVESAEGELTTKLRINVATRSLF